jgi:hypothetical protein
VQLVEEEDDRSARLGDLLEDGLQALLELTAVLRARDEGADVERVDAPLAQRLGHVAGDDALGEALGDRGLADAGLADQDRVVLRAAREDLDDAPDLVVAADDRIELALLRGGGEVAAVLLERLVGVLGRLVRDAVRPADLLEGLGQGILGRAGAAQRLAGLGDVAREREQEVLRRDVLVAELAGLVLRGAEDLEQLAGRGRLGARGVGRVGGEPVERGVDVGADLLGARADLAQHGQHDTLGGLEQREHQVLGRDLGVAAGGGELDGGPERLLRLDGETVLVHGRASVQISVRVTKIVATLRRSYHVAAWSSSTARRRPTTRPTTTSSWCPGGPRSPRASTSTSPARTARARRSRSSRRT